MSTRSGMVDLQPNSIRQGTIAAHGVNICRPTSRKLPRRGIMKVLPVYCINTNFEPNPVRRLNRASSCNYQPIWTHLLLQHCPLSCVYGSTTSPSASLPPSHHAKPLLRGKRQSTTSRAARCQNMVYYGDSLATVWRQNSIRI